MNDETYPGGKSDSNQRILIINLPLWLEKAVEQKNPLVPLALAYSILLECDDLDKKLLLLSTLN